MKKFFSFCFALFAVLCFGHAALAEESKILRVVKTTINSETENAELCLQFDKTLSSTSPAKLAANLKLESRGEVVNPANIAAADSSLCLFPLDRDKLYHLNIKGTRSSDEAIGIAPYKLTFTIPDRTPSLNFTGKNGATNEFGSYDEPFLLRAVNVSQVKLEVYRIADAAQIAAAWQRRAQTVLVPTESAYLARTKGKTIWREEEVFDHIKNITNEKRISLREKIPDMGPGLYLLVADATKAEKKETSKNLTPLSAVWFVKTDLVIRAVRDDLGITVFSSNKVAGLPKGSVHFEAYDLKSEKKAETQSAQDGIGRILYPEKLRNRNDLTTVVAKDQMGNVAFGDIEDLPPLSGNGAVGKIDVSQKSVQPLSVVDVSFVLPLRKMYSELGTLRLSKDNVAYADFSVPSPSPGYSKFSFTAPPKQGLWSMQLRKADGTVLAEEKLIVTSNVEAPQLSLASERDILVKGASWPVAIKSLSSSGKPAPLISGRISIGWKKLDGGAFGWNGYSFGNPSSVLPPDEHVVDFLTDLSGSALVPISIPSYPQGHGLYQAVLKVEAEPDSGIPDPSPLIIPMSPEEDIVGIKPLAPGARFSQNGLARFSLISLSSDGKALERSNLSYQIYEEGRSFGWYQNEGRWHYKPEAQLRPLGGGALSIKADGSSVLEWPVNAGNYRLEILDQNGRTLAQSSFSAGWNSKDQSVLSTLPLKIKFPKQVQPGREAKALITLPQPSIVSAIVADTRVRLALQEFREKGLSAITFIPSAEWGKTISLSVEAIPLGAQDRYASLRSVVEASLEEVKEENADRHLSNTILVVPEDPSALLLRKDDRVTLTFGIQNNGPTNEKYHYAFSGSPGIKFGNASTGQIIVGGSQNQSLSIIVSGATEGTKELRLEISGPHAQRIVRVWPMSIIAGDVAFRSGETVTLKPRQAIKNAQLNPKAESTVLLSRKPMNGLVEILAYVFHARPFTTDELALTINFLKSWEGTLEQVGIAPGYAVAARRQKQMQQLLTYQNKDGGFGPYRDSESTIEGTSAALEALTSYERTLPAKNLAIAWLKQRLANSWFEEKERNARAAAYAALARANAADRAGLHYFADISSTAALSPEAEANIAAAFKFIKDHDASAFWIKKMIEDNGKLRTPAVLNALSTTDALSSDDVISSMNEMGQAIRSALRPELKDAAGLLRAVAANNENAGKSRLLNGKELREFLNVLVLKGNESVLQAYRNDDPEPLFMTIISQTQPSSSKASHDDVMVRRLYRMNGVEVSSPAKPVTGELYLIGLEGKLPRGAKGKSFVVEDGGNWIRPKSCVLSRQMNTLSFIPWFTVGNLSKTSHCIYSDHEINFIVAPTTNDEGTFSTAYFAYIDSQSVAELPPPKMRLLK